MIFSGEMMVQPPLSIKQKITAEQKSSEFKGELFNKTFIASLWTLFAHGSSQMIRFIGNLILTRLLIPDDFGLMQLVFIFIQAIYMFSDLGLGPNLIQHPKAEDPLFLRTSWTIQWIRGFVIEAILIIIAQPVAYLYHAPLLAQLIPVTGICAIFDGFASMNLTLCYKKMNLKKVYLLDLTSQIVGVSVMLICAWHWRSVWTLILGAVVSSAVKTVLSQVVFDGPKMRCCWDQGYVKDIVKFGRWIFISSMAGFLLSRLDKVLLGLYLSIGDLGLYGLAYGIVAVFYDLLQTLGDRVLMPLYSHLWNHSTHNIKNKIFKVRALLMILGFIPFILLYLWGQKIIDLLYPQNYHSAGWMLRILAIGFSFKSITVTLMPFLFSVGNSFRAMLVILCSACLLIVSMVTGGHYFGEIGIIWAIPVAEILAYPILTVAIYQYGIWLPWLDICGYSLIAIILLLFAT